VFESIAREHRRTAVQASGLDLSNVRAVADYLRLETIASGHGDALLAVLQELLLIPQSSRGTWDAVLAGTKVKLVLHCPSFLSIFLGRLFFNVIA
jgi:hypothetical protein